MKRIKGHAHHGMLEPLLQVKRALLHLTKQNRTADKKYCENNYKERQVLHMLS
jgi:hypothetical protein